jgi:hypothetical protein
MSDFSALLGFEDRTKLVVPTLNEKVGAAKLKGECGKLFVTLPGINPIPFDDAYNDRHLPATRRCGYKTNRRRISGGGLTTRLRGCGTQSQRAQRTNLNRLLDVLRCANFEAMQLRFEADCTVPQVKRGE